MKRKALHQIIGCLIASGNTHLAKALGGIDWNQSNKNFSLINAIPGQDPQEELYNGDGDGDGDYMGEALERIFMEYYKIWGRRPYREELEAIFNFCSRPIRCRGESKEDHGIDYLAKDRNNVSAGVLENRKIKGLIASRLEQKGFSVGLTDSSDIMIFTDKPVTRKSKKVSPGSKQPYLTSWGVAGAKKFLATSASIIGDKSVMKLNDSLAILNSLKLPRQYHKGPMIPKKGEEKHFAAQARYYIAKYLYDQIKDRLKKNKKVDEKELNLRKNDLKLAEKGLFTFADSTSNSEFGNSTVDLSGVGWTDTEA